MSNSRIAITGWRRVVLALSLALFALSGTPAHAQTVTTAGPEELHRLVTEAQSQGAEVIVLTAPPGTTGALAGAEAPGFGARVHSETMRARARFREIIAGIGDFPARAATAIRSHHPDGSLTWPLTSALLAVLFLAIGYGAERLYNAWAKPYFAYLFNPVPESRAEKISYLLFGGLTRLLGIVLQVVVALILAAIFSHGVHHIQVTQIAVITGVAGVRVLLLFFRSLFATDAPSHRLLNLSDADARSLTRGLAGLLVIVALSIGVCTWMDALDLVHDAHLLSLIGASLMATLLMIGFALWQRAPVAGMILGAGPPEDKPLGLRLLARAWHVPAILYFAAAWAVMAVRLVLDLPNALGLVTGPILVLLLAIAAYGVALLIVERVFARRAADTAEVSDAADVPETIEATEVSDDDAPVTWTAMVEDGDGPRSFKDLAQRASALVVVAAAIWSVFDLWGIDLVQSGGTLHALWEVLLVGFLAYLAFASVRIAIDRKIAEEGGGDAAEPGEEGGAGGTSRLATLLPLFRNFLLVVIAAIAGMIALSELGVDIAPLFAGAGVVGLAIGFGAQTMIRDIFAGAFFLMDDAFRKGEYIDIGTVQGTVERISLRSLQIRHHNGPLHTVPFGEIRYLTNFSRDWVIMKLELRVTYDTDVEKVRKLVKKLGQRLLEHPEIGAKFLQPLKSQGVLAMEDSAMIVRVKFMTRPGDQFDVRKVVYTEIRDLFAKEGIKFAHREVTVRVAETPDGRPLTEGEKEAVAGAVRPAIEPATPQATGTGSR